MGKAKAQRPHVHALTMRQWRTEWNGFEYDEKDYRRRPEPELYLFSISAAWLRSLSGVYRRSPDRPSGAQELNTQRRHEPGRSEKIARFIQYSYPWSSLGETKRKAPTSRPFRKPGWLPTAVVVNLLTANDKRDGKSVAADDVIEVEQAEGGLARVILPAGSESSGWVPKALPPIEVIDGQHRLLAFDEEQLKESDKEYQLPVVAFHGLDRSWQAYLFYTINIKPKKINTSLAFDLYPLLRTEDWLEPVDEVVVYREARAQELVDLLFRLPQSPWHERINMLGSTGEERTARYVTQASWIRALLDSFIRPWKAKRRTTDGLFGAKVGADKKTLSWSLAQQAALLIAFGSDFQEAIKKTDDAWTKVLRKEAKEKQDAKNAKEKKDSDGDAALYGRHTLLNQDQGIRALLGVVNDLCFTAADELDLEAWTEDEEPPEDTTERVQASCSVETLLSGGQEHQVVGQYSEVALAFAALLGSPGGGAAEPALVPAEGALGLPPLAAHAPVPAAV